MVIVNTASGSENKLVYLEKYEHTLRKIQKQLLL